MIGLTLEEREQQEQEQRLLRQGRKDREKLRAQVDDLTYRRDLLAKGGRPGPNWVAYAAIARTMLNHGISDVVVRVALNKLIMGTEAVKPQTVDTRVRQMIADATKEKDIL